MLDAGDSAGGCLSSTPASLWKGDRGQEKKTNRDVN